MTNGVLFKWESNNRGLDHKCGTCKTVLSSPRAKKTCFGVHEEVCPKYHKTLFYVGSSHKCDACRKSTLQHVKRHRDIASLVQGILHLDDARARTSLLFNRTRKARKDDGFEFLKLDTGFIDEIGEFEEWPDTDTVCDDDVDGQIPGLAETKENMDFKKVQKAKRKIVQRQSQFQITTAEELQRVEDALHPARDSLYKNGGGDLESNGLTNNATIDTNIAFNSRTFRYSSLRTTVQRKKFEKHNGISTPRSRIPLEGSQMSAILNRLGISTSAVSNSTKERTSRLVRLRRAIKKDLDCVENENRETMTRMAGYWRYVNRRTYNAMVRNKELWDWATGAKLEEIEEEEESELESTDDDDDQRSPRFSESDTFIETPQLENWDEDFIFDSDNPLHLASLPERILEQRGGQMLENGAIDFSEKSTWSVIAEEAPFPAIPVNSAAMATMMKENASPWAGIKDTRRIPCRSTSPPSSHKKIPARSLSPPSPRLSIKKTTSHHPRKYIPISISAIKPSARNGKSLSNHLADLRFPQPPKTKGQPRKTDIDIPTTFYSIAATSTKNPFRVTPAAAKRVPVNLLPEVSPDPQDDDTVRVPAAAVHANSDVPEAVPFKDPNNRFSPLVWPECQEEKMRAGSRKQQRRK